MFDHKFIDKISGKEVDPVIVFEVVKSVMKDMYHITPRASGTEFLKTCSFVAGMFKDTIGWDVYRAIEYVGKQKSQQREMLKKLEERKSEIGKLADRPLREARKRRFGLREDSTSGHGGLHPDHASVIPNPMSIPKADGYYNYYRISLLMARQPDEYKIDPETAFGNNPFTSAYTDCEQDMINTAAKLCGFKPARLGTPKSEEPSDVHRVSPTNHNSGKHPQ